VCGGPAEKRPRLIAHIVEQLGRFVPEKREAGLGAQHQIIFYSRATIADCTTTLSSALRH
jgi:hypothetical protein